MKGATRFRTSVTLTASLPVRTPPPSLAPPTRGDADHTDEADRTDRLLSGSQLCAPGLTPTPPRLLQVLERPRDPPCCVELSRTRPDPAVSRCSRRFLSR